MLAVAAARGAPMALAAGQPNRARAMSTLAIGADPDDTASLAVLAQASWQLRDRDISRDAAERVLALTDGNLVVTARIAMASCPTRSGVARRGRVPASRGRAGVARSRGDAGRDPRVAHHMR